MAGGTFYVLTSADPGGDGTTPNPSSGDGTHAFRSQEDAIVGTLGTLTEPLIIKLLDGFEDAKPDWDGYGGITQTNNITITTHQPTDGHLGVPGNGYTIQNDTGNTVDIYEPWTVIEKICVNNGHPTWSAILCRTGADNCTIRRIISKGYNGEGNAIRFDSNSQVQNTYFESCLFIDCGNTRGAFERRRQTTQLGRNCTIAKSYRGILVDIESNKTTFHNTVVYGSTDGNDWSPNNVRLDQCTYCASGDGTAPAQTGTVVSNTITDADFVNPAADDYRLASGSVLIDGGDINEMAAFDIAGNPFTTNDVGCYAFSSGPSGETGAVDDSSTFSDVIAGSFSGIGLAIDNADVTDQVNGLGKYQGSLPDVLNVFDFVVGSTAVGVTVDDVAHYTDVLVALVSHLASEADLVTITDEVIGDTSKRTGQFADSTEVTDEFVAAAAYSGVISENVLFSDLVREPMEPGATEGMERVIQDVIKENVQEVM